MAIIASEDHHIDIDASRAKQGLRGRHVLIILVVSITLTVLAFALAYAVNHRGLASVNGAPTTSAAEVRGSDTPLRPAQQ